MEGRQNDETLQETLKIRPRKTVSFWSSNETLTFKNNFSCLDDWVKTLTQGNISRSLSWLSKSSLFSYFHEDGVDLRSVEWYWFICMGACGVYNCKIAKKNSTQDYPVFGFPKYYSPLSNQIKSAFFLVTRPAVPPLFGGARSLKILGRARW